MEVRITHFPNDGASLLHIHPTDDLLLLYVRHNLLDFM